MFKKNVTVVMLLLLISGMIFAIGGSDRRTGNEIKALMAISGGKDDAENVLFQEALSRALGVPVIWEKPADYDQVLLQKLGAGEAYDLIYLNQPAMYTLVQQGMLTDLTSRLNGSQIIRQNYPAGELEKIAVNGRYYAGFNKLEVFTLPNVNKAITDRVGINLDNLSTLDDYYNMLRAVKTHKETVEGIRPYYPFFIYMRDVWDLQPWFSSVDLQRGVFRDASGRRYAPYATPQAQPVWEWLARLNREGLIDPASFTGSTTDMRNKMWQSQEIVLNVDWVAWTGLYNNLARGAGTYPNVVNVVGLLGTKGPSGKFRLEQGAASLLAVPVNSRNPDGGFKVIEYFATKEGGLLLTAGIEGHDYNMQGGRIALTPVGQSHALDHGAPFPISTQFDFNIFGGEIASLMASFSAIGRRSDVLVEPLGFDNGALDSRVYLDVFARWMTDCMMGRMDAATAIRSAVDDLRTRRLID